jgi:hypothetical protein
VGDAAKVAESADVVEGDVIGGERFPVRSPDLHLERDGPRLSLPSGWLPAVVQDQGLVASPYIDLEAAGEADQQRARIEEMGIGETVARANGRRALGVDQEMFNHIGHVPIP